MSVTWETATDWDNAQSEDGVVHESVANTDHNDATIVKQGYRIASPYKAASLVGYWAFHEDSGSTAYDFSGNNNDGTINGATVGATGLLGTSSYSFDGTDDYVSLPTFAAPSAYTVAFWSNLDNHNSDHQQLTMADGPHFLVRSETDGNQYLYHRNDSATWVSISAASATGSWIFWTATWDGSTIRLYKNGTEQASASVSSMNSQSNGNSIGGDSFNSVKFVAGDIAGVRYDNAALSASEIQYLYDVVATPGALTGAVKTA